MLGRTNTGGGGGGLNFKVVGGTTAPSNPKENTIWINTANRITSWIFSATEPSPAEDGMVWITTGKESTSAFNALKRNCIMVYPLCAWQCISGRWTDAKAKIYQNGWSDMLTEVVFFGDGAFNESTFGAIVKKNGTYTIVDGSFRMTNGVEFTHSTAFDLSAFNTIEVEVSMYKWGNITLSVVGTDKSFIITDGMTDGYKGTVTCDISGLSGMHYINLKCQANSGSNYTETSSIKFKV